MTKRYDYDYSYPEYRRPIRTGEGLKTRSKQGKIGQSWWARRWIEAMEQLVDARRLGRGRGYARSGQVLSIDEQDGEVVARVQGSRASPYRVTIELAPLSDAQWEAAIDQMAEQALFAAQLLAGEMPENIEEAFEAAGASLFPEKPGELETDCSCPDIANPCKHVAATHYILGEQFDEDPFLLFRLRGRTQEQILDALQVRRAAAGQLAESGTEYEAAPAAEPAVPLEELLDTFWQAGEPLEGLAAAIKPPPVPLPILKRLGQPIFLPDEDLAALLGPAYDLIAREALRAAYGEDGVAGQDRELGSGR